VFDAVGTYSHVSSCHKRVVVGACSVFNLRIARSNCIVPIGHRKHVGQQYHSSLIALSMRTTNSNRINAMTRDTRHTSSNPRDGHLGRLASDSNVHLLRSIVELAAIHIADRDHGTKSIRRESLQYPAIPFHINAMKEFDKIQWQSVDVTVSQCDSVTWYGMASYQIPSVSRNWITSAAINWH
jgi:hypothetical protein